MLRTHGKTREEAIHNGEEVIEMYGVAESRYEPLTESFEGSLRISQNHSAIQQRQMYLDAWQAEGEFILKPKTIQTA